MTTCGQFVLLQCGLSRMLLMHVSGNEDPSFSPHLFTSRLFLKNGGRYSFWVHPCLRHVSPYILVAMKASFLKIPIYNICKNNIAKMFSDSFFNLKLFI